MPSVVIHSIFKAKPLLCASVQFSSVAQSCPTLCNPMACSTPGFPVLHQLPELLDTQVHLCAGLRENTRIITAWSVLWASVAFACLASIKSTQLFLWRFVLSPTSWGLMGLSVTMSSYPHNGGDAVQASWLDVVIGSAVDTWPKSQPIRGFSDMW